ncbi:MAG: hypothetical protein GY832_25940 [Chloroflexi bacterium]|nr:hypothetical protein [Chloroflexota bacterium]
MPTIELERTTLEYTNISPWRLSRVSQAERNRYIKEELGGVEPKPPTYTVTLGGGKLPDGQPLPAWEETYDYTAEHVEELRNECAELENRPATSAAWARLAELREAVATWDAHFKIVSELGQSVRAQRWKVGLWHVFGLNLPDSDDWIEELETDGIDAAEIPTDKRERLYYWLEMVAVASQGEFNQLIALVEGRGELVREAREITRAMFQRPLGRS